MPFRYLLIVVLGLLCCGTVAQAACQTPQSLNTGTPGSRSVQVSWYNPNGGSPSFQVQYRFAGQVGWNRSDVGTSTSASLANLAPKTSYEWRVRAVCAANDTSAYSAAISFTTVCAAPSYIYSGTPTHESVYLNWSYYGNESPTYQVQYRAAGAAIWLIKPALSSTSTSLTGLTNDTSYEWRVRSFCSASDSSAFSSTGAFRTVCVSPGYTATNNVTYQSARLTWGSAYYGAAYEVHWRAAGSSTWTVISGLTTTDLQLNGLTNDVTYEWKVRTVCSASAQSAFTTATLFRTSCAPPQSPNTGSINVDAADLRWTNATGVYTADLRWRAAGAANWTDVPGINSSDYALTGLQPNTTYEWQVRSACGATDKSGYTAPVLFLTSCDVPTGLVTPVVDATTLTFAWTAKAPVTLQYRAAGSANWLTVSPSGATYTLRGLVNNTVYEWRVRTECGPGVSSDYTATQLVTTRCLAPVSPGSSLNIQNELVCSWYGISGYVYELQWRLAGMADWTVASGIARSSYTIRPTVLNATYEWRVRRVCSATDFSDFTPTSTYTPTCQLNYLSLSYYRKTTSSVELSWYTSSSSGVYELQVQPTGAASWTVVSGLTTSPYTLTGLTPGVTYQWRMRRMCTPTIGSDFTNGSSFSTQCATPPSYFYQNTVSTTSASLSWGGYDSYAPYEVNYRPVGQANWQVISNILTSSVVLSGLTPNTTYEWRVQSICPVGLTATFGATQTFSTQCGGVQSSFSVQSVRATEATVSWQGLSGPLTYDVQYREAGSGTWLTRNVPANEINQTTYTGSGPKQYTFYGLTTGRTYEWQVRAVCEAGVTSAFAGGPSFTTQCPVPVFGGPASQPDNSRLTIYWNPFSTGETFDIQWRAQGATAWLSESGFTNSTYTLTNLTAGTTYEYRVQRTCSSTLTSGFSAIQTQALFCLTPQNVYARAGVGTSVNLSWEYTAATADEFTRTTYSMQYRVSGSNSWTTLSVPANATPGQYPTVTYSVTGLTANTTYEFQVRAECAAQQVSAYTYSVYYYIDCPSIGSTSTTPGITSANLFWYTYKTDASFQLQWRQVGSTAWTSVAIINGVYGYNQYSLTGLTPNSAYEWRIANNCGNGFLSAYTSPQSFNTGCNATTAYSPYGTVGATSIALNWSYNSPFAGTSTVQYRPAGAVVWTNSPPQTSLSLSLTGLTTYITYEVRIRSSCGDGGAFGLSNSTTFQPICRPVSYSYYDSQGPQSMRISWNTDNASSPVTIQWRPVGAASWQEQAGVNSPYQLTGLTAATEYEYRFLTTCTPAITAFSSTYLFTTTSPSVVSPYIRVDSTGTQTAYLSLMNTEGTEYTLRLRVLGTTNWLSTGLLTATTYLIQNLLPTTAYEAQVVTGTAGAPIYSSLIQFSTICPQPGSPVANRISAGTALLQWGQTRSIPSAVQWRAGGTSVWTTSPAVTSGVYMLTGLLPATTYEWRVGTVCGGAQGYSPINSFRTTSLCPVPYSIYARTVNPAAAVLVWENTNPAVLSTLRYRVAGTTAWTLLPGLVGGVVSLTGLTPNTTYDAAVSFDCGGGSTSAFSSSTRFTTRCTVPYIAYTQTAPTQARLSWEQGGPEYIVRWRLSNTANWSTVPTSATYLTLTNLTPNTYYEWQVRSACSPDVDGSYSYGSTFSTQCSSPSLYGRLASVLSASAVRLNWIVYWGSAPDLYTYTVGWRVAGTSVWQTAPGLTAPYTLTGLAPNTAYEWQVRGDCATQFGDPLTFTTSCALLTSFRIDQQTSSSARLIWTDALGGATYDLQWRVVGTNAWTTVPNLTGTAYTLTGLTENTAYEWQVRGQCGPNTPYKTTLAFRLISERQTSVMTTKTGNWNDPTVWTCTCIPTSTDVVLIRHLVTIPANFSGYSKRIFYESNGRLTFSAASQLKPTL